MTLVFDAEPLLAYFQGEAGAEVVRRLLERVRTQEEAGWVSPVNLAEVLYTLFRRIPDQANALVDWLLAIGLKVDPGTDTWHGAAKIKSEFRVGLADAFALETARRHGATLIAGRDRALEVATGLGIALRRIHNRASAT